MTKTKESRAHEQVEWTKHKLDEIDATLAAIEKTADDVRGEARKDAEQALEKLKAARAAAGKGLDAMGADINAAREITEKAYESLAAELTDAELALQQYLAAARDQADVVRKTVTARAKAQRESWQKSADAIRTTASKVVEQAYEEFDTAITRLSDARDEAEEKLGKATAAGDETWKAFKDGIEEARATRQRTWKKISKALSKIA
ncbi:MAG: hypothetical protein KJ587_19985 [Alphaproteobacteria bacterium]|nr:hypothetical protein [Alphaproteobacteria bacterium]